jgi:hypothetical protein
MDRLLRRVRHGEYLGGGARWGNGRDGIRGPGVRERPYLAATLSAGLALFVNSAGAMNLTPAMIELFAAVEMAPPTPHRMTVCYGFRCQRRMELVFTDGERTLLMNTLAKGRASAADERKAIQQAFVWFDRRVGEEVGTSRRVPNADIRTLDAAHNFDCWDTTRNEVSLLLILQEWGALRHHTVGDPRYRGNIFIGQLPHNTSVIVEKATGMKWVVDMWTTAYGQVPDVMPLNRWLKEL